MSAFTVRQLLHQFTPPVLHQVRVECMERFEQVQVVKQEARVHMTRSQKAVRCGEVIALQTGNEFPGVC